MESDDSPASIQASQHLSQALRLSEEATTILASLGRVLQDAALGGRLPLDYSDDWELARTRYEQALANVEDMRDAIATVMARVNHDAGDVGASQLMWVDQLVGAHGRLQSALTDLSTFTSSAFEAMRPAIIDRYLRYSPRAPRWSESWPRDPEFAQEALAELQVDASMPVDQLDLKLARLRWELGWPQQRIADVAGLSQPSIAARLSRVENIISVQAAVNRIVSEGRAGHFQAVSQRLQLLRTSRVAIGELVLDRADVSVDLLVLDAGLDLDGRGRGAERGTLVDLLPRLEDASLRQTRLIRDVRGLALFVRDRGVVDYFAVVDVATALRQWGGLPADAFLRRLRERLAPARSLAELIQEGNPKGGESGF